MALFHKKKEENEEAGCASCVYAESIGQRIFCRRKNVEKKPFERCGSYEFDLIKHRPGALFSRGGEIIEEFEKMMEEEKK